MSDPMKTDDLPPLTPISFWQENFAAWSDLSTATRTIWAEQANRLVASQASEAEAAETMTNDILRVLSDFNLRHWHNTARALDAVPSWMRTPKVIDGGAITDWFDRFKRREQANKAAEAPQRKVTKRPANTFKMPVEKQAPDDLTRIKGIGPKLSGRLNDLGVYNFKQIAAWSKTEASQIDQNLATKGRVDRDNWVSQARKLIANGSAHLH